jgi:hypothetical protein
MSTRPRRFHAVYSVDYQPIPANETRARRARRDRIAYIVFSIYHEYEWWDRRRDPQSGSIVRIVALNLELFKLAGYRIEDPHAHDPNYIAPWR